MKNREKDRLSKSTSETPRERHDANDVERVHRRSRKVLRNKKSSSEVESSEESTKSEEKRSERIRKRSLKVAKAEIEETSEEAIETREIISSTSKNAYRSSTNTSRKERERSSRTKGKDRNTEIPIAEMLRKALDKEHNDYNNDKAMNFSALTTDKVYVQGNNGFSVVKIPINSEEDRGYAMKRLSKDIEVLRDSTVAIKDISAPITIAILAQKHWKRTALVYQGLLAGMALVHLTMVRLPLANLRGKERNIIRIFFDTSMEFISRYSLFSEIYRSLFSLMIALSVISIFDKFDLAHLKPDRLNYIRRDYVGSVITIPLYVATLCLHETFANVDDRLALIHYRDFNCSLWNNNTTNIEDFLDGLATWQKINISKDLLAALSWFLVAVGTQDDTLLMHLESMQEYRNDIETPNTE